LQRFALLRLSPVLREFHLVQLIPLKHVPESSPRELALHDSVLYPDRDLVLPIDSVEMRWLMIPIEHRYHDAEKAAQLRHMFILALALRLAHPA